MIHLPDGAIHIWSFFPRAADPREDEDEPAVVLVRSRLQVLHTLGCYRAIAPEERASGRCARVAPSFRRGEAPGLMHSVSRSGGATVVAVTRGWSVGVDIERIDPSFPWAAITRRFFAPGEKADIESLWPCERLDAFYKGWTSKEAYLKGIGLGLSGSMRGFTVCCDPAAPPRLRSGLPDTGPGWRLYPLFDPPRPAWTGAIAYYGDEPTMTVMNET